MNKKPAVAAKAAPRKRGRPAGSTNKPKIIKMLDIQIAEGRKKVEQANKKVDWKLLCERLQEALAKEMKENDFLKDELCRKRSFFERLVCLATGSV